MPSPSPLRATERLRDRLTEVVLGQSSFSDPALADFLRQRLRCNDKANGALVADPLVEGVAPYVTAPTTLAELAGTLIHPGVIGALTRGLPGEDYRFDPTMQPYAHQLESWRHLVQPEPRSLVVTSGTGSGKTECFLVPLLHDLLSNADGQPGVRAIILYPLNALIASQQSRLRRWMAPFGGRIRFGLYNGLTREEVKAAEDRPYPEEARSRVVIRATPPQVLVTNVSMMEYLTIRRKDRPLLENSRGRLRWIILDEAHSYVGSAAAEVALLLRRVMMAFGVEPGQVRFVATSATIGSGEGVREALARYLADLAGVAPAQVHVVEGHRTIVGLPAPGPPGPLRQEALHDRPILSRNPAVQAFVREAERAPVSLGRAAALLRPTGLAAIDVMEAVASDEGGTALPPLLPLRVHQFMRAVPGLWSCVDAACLGPRPAGWPFGAPLFGRADSCPTCHGRVYEMTRCGECGEAFLVAFQRGDMLDTGQSAPEEDEFADASERAGAEVEDVELGGAVSGQEPDHTDPDGERRSPASGIRRLLPARPVNALHALGLDPRSGRLLDRVGEGQAVQATRDGGETCPHCRAKAKPGETVDRPFRFGAPFLVGNAVPIVLECVPAHSKPMQILPAGGRGLLSFSDSRQGTARFAAAVETSSERSYVRAILFHMAQKAARADAVSPELALLNSTIEELEQHAPSEQLRSYLSKQRAKRDALLREAQSGAPWDEVARSVGQDPHVNHWMRAVWRDRDARFRQGETALGQFLMLRELARRPRRANSLETLGLAQLRFETIEKRGAEDVPDPLREVGVTEEAWRDFLYLLLDTPVRGSFAIKMDDDDVRWLVTRGGLRRNVVGPDRPRNDRTDLTWPQARSGGIQSSAVLWMERLLGFDASDGRDRAAMNEALSAAWAQLGPLFDTVGADRSLDLGRARIAPVTQAWRCPVTRRVLTRLAFGYSPYGHRERSPHAEQVPPVLVFPTLPVLFPDTGERETVETWLHTDPEVAALRGSGVWGDYHDRASLLSPFMRAEEHSAQQPPYRLRKFEEEFRDGQINLLACSTTMEMGVDIGSVSAVLMTNVPPSIANYRQRGGRAGRRGQGFSSSLTFARSTPLDQAAFMDPLAYLGSGLLPPDVRLDSVRIVQRHANALLLARWFSREGGELLRMTVGVFFGLPEQAVATHEAVSPLETFCAWMDGPGAAGAVDHDLKQLVHGSALQGRTGLPLDAAAMFRARSVTLHGQWRALQDELREAPSEAAKRSISMSLRRLCRETLLKELANSALLPGHGFPTSVVPFEINHEVSGSESDEGGARNRRYDSPSRNADVALREYAPGAQVVIDGLVWTSAGLTLNWQRPAHESAVRDIQSLRWHWRCTQCGAADCERSRIEACPNCAASPIEATRFIEPAGFRVDAAAQPTADTDQVRFIPCRSARISTRRAAWEPLLDPRLGRGRVSAEGQVFHSTAGADGGGFHVCLACGRAAEDRASLANHAPIWSAGEGVGRRNKRPPRCQGNDESFTVVGPIELGYELQTDVAELQPAMLEEKGGAIALAVALRESHARRLGINPRELGFAAEKRRGHLGQATHSVFLFDCNSGGAGFATRMLADVPGLLRDARRILECQTPGCVRGCPACVITGDMTEPQQRLVDRRAALACLAGMEAGFAAMPEADRAVPDARLSRPVADDLVRRLDQGAVVTMFAHEPFDLGALDRLPFSALFDAARRSGATCRIALPATLLGDLNDVERRGLRDAAIRGGATVVIASPDLAPNGARLLATLSQRGTIGAWYSRDMSATRLDGGWGVAVQHSVVEADAAVAPDCVPVAIEDLEPSPTLHSSVVMIEGTRPWGFSRFGAELVKLLRPHLEDVDLWRPGELTALSYSDRYLHSPLAAGLALHALARLRLELGPKNEMIPLKIYSSVRASDLARPPYVLHHDWQRINDRKDVLSLLAQALGMDLDLSANGTQHARALTLSFGKEQGCLYFDQGFGYWRTNIATKFEFAASPQAQAKALQASTAAVVGLGHTYIAVRRI